jgi:hypothetical protein
MSGGLVLTVDGPSGEQIRLRWHVEGTLCADEDPLHAAMADAVSLPDGPESDRACLLAYQAVRRRAAEHGVDVLRGVVDVRRDFAMGTRTLRGPGLLWGSIAPREVRRAG